MNTLQQRVNCYLSARPREHSADDPGSELALDSLLSMLQKAEFDLQAAQSRVERLKWELAKARK